MQLRFSKKLIELTSTASGATTNYSYSLNIQSTAGYAEPETSPSASPSAIVSGVEPSP